jgi:endonuclease YncB( thermonuclease family)
MGILRIQGTIDINQFWPIGSSDADTTSLKLKVSENSFQYKADDSKQFKTTNVFDTAISKGQGSKAVIKINKTDNSKTITIRLQGVDAPELHYKSSPLKNTSDISAEERTAFNAINKERRQQYSESATYALANYLKTLANKSGLVNAVFESNVEMPGDVIDTYGRFIGNIVVGKQDDINLWLVENGWAIPTFYTSMTIKEIESYIQAWKKGKTKPKGIGKAITKEVGKFDWKLLYRPASEVKKFKIGEDAGKLLMPKIFRRQAAWMVSKKAGVIDSKISFKAFLEKKPDQVVLLDDLKLNGIHSAIVYNLHEFITTKNTISKSAEELVFKEKSSMLVDGKGKKIEKW